MDPMSMNLNNKHLSNICIKLFFLFCQPKCQGHFGFGGYFVTNKHICIILLDLHVRCLEKKVQHISPNGGGLMMMNPMVQLRKKSPKNETHPRRGILVATILGRLRIRITRIYKPWNGHLEGERCPRKWGLTIVTNYLQVLGWSSK